VTRTACFIAGICVECSARYLFEYLLIGFKHLVVSTLKVSKDRMFDLDEVNDCGDHGQNRPRQL
jgi:hypothetical protein